MSVIILNVYLLVASILFGAAFFVSLSMPYKTTATAIRTAFYLLVSLGGILLFAGQIAQSH